MFVICVDSVGGGGSVLVKFDDPSDWKRRLDLARSEHPNAYLAEVVIEGADPRNAIPGELDRAIDAWNLMCSRLKERNPPVRLPKVSGRDRLVRPFRTWKCAIGSRDYLLEMLIPDIEAQPFLYSGSFAFTFAWLFGQKKGEWNSDKVHARAYGSGGNGGNGQATERDYLQVAARVAVYHKFHVDGESFEYGTGVTYEKWQELQKQFGKAER